MVVAIEGEYRTHKVRQGDNKECVFVPGKGRVQNRDSV